MSLLIKNLLITGGAGFIGSNFIKYMLKNYRDINIFNLDILTYAGNLENLSDIIKLNKNYFFIKNNICDKQAIEKLAENNKFDAIINFAAETHVDRSLHIGVKEFIETNIIGTQNLIDICIKYNISRYIQISTDEVYGSLGPEGKFTENTPIQPNNPYAATKAGADLLVRAACNSYGLNAVITRCSNNFGPYQFPEKLIPLMIANALADKSLPVYGDGKNIRDWIYVEDHCRAIDLVLRDGRSGEVYNIGAMNDVQNIELIEMILKYLNKPKSLIKFVQDRPGHDKRYAMDASKIKAELNWQPIYSFEEALKNTIDWYINNQKWLNDILNGSYRDYYNKIYKNR